VTAPTNAGLQKKIKDPINPLIVCQFKIVSSNSKSAGATIPNSSQQKKRIKTLFPT
jgi:hypothetical protein